MKLYGEFSKEDWLHAIGIGRHDVPESFIIHGEWNHAENLKLWKEQLSDDMLLPKWNTVLGKQNGVLTGFANVYGSPMAAAICHQFASIGTKCFIQTGYFGGLSQAVKYGDIFIVTEAKMEDGVSSHYKPGHNVVKSDEQLVNKAMEYCEKKNYSYVTGSVISTNTPFLETSKLVLKWSLDGNIGVDMETAATLAVANKFNRKAVSLLNLSDHLLQGDTFYAYTAEREKLEAEIDKRIREIAFHLNSPAAN
ncbi:uridine phosphorylase [Niallia taxi]|uniref:phosphorylase family protein n=1 Tax=Niallia taxi TaxID=2499688 RepID=UPI00203F0803|nr:uridine phosphorylase [Niallia taxi]MCM3214615.1 uridine phosphorylase [Niallia taxi]